MICRRHFLAGAAAAWPARAFALTDGTLVIRSDGDLQILDPAFQSGDLEEELGRCLFTALSKLSPAGTPVAWQPDAAQTLVQTDPLTINFTLRDGLNWTNGYGPVTAEDVQFSFTRVADPAMKSPWAYAFEYLDRVDVVDKNRGIIRLKHPCIPFMFTSLPFWMGHIVCKRAVLSAGGKFTTTPPATCGAYIIDNWRPKEFITLVRNPAWTGQPPAFPKLRFQIIEDSDTAIRAFDAKAIDFTRINLNTLAAYKSTPPKNARLFTMPGTRYNWLCINIGNRKLADIRIRRAIQYAIDVEQILAGAYSDLCQASTGVVLPNMLGRRDKILFPYNPAESRRLLQAANATDLHLELSINNDATDVLTAQIIQALLADVGIDVQIRLYDEGVYWTLGDKTAGDGWKALELVLAHSTSAVDPSENLNWFRPAQIGAWNWSQFNSPDYEALYQSGMGEADPAERSAIYRHMQDLMEQSGGFVFLVNETYAAVCRQDMEPCILPDDMLDVTRFTRPQGAVPTRSETGKE
jgi:peptide/nickel transport system substrate-binding protein